MKLSLALFVTSLLVASTLSASLTDGLLAYYPFTGSANDVSANANHGTVHGAVLSTDRFGTPESSYLFDGIDDHIVVADNLPLRLSGPEFSISMWLFETERNVGYQDALLVKRGSGVQEGWFFSLTGMQSASSIGVGRIYYQVSGGVDPRVYTPMEVPLNTWAHIVITYKANEQRASIYLNGELVAYSVNLPSPNFNTVASMYIGSDSQGAAYNFHGKIDEVRLYDRLLSPSEIQSLAGIITDLTAPQDLHITRSGANVDLSWDAVPNASGYSIYSSSDPSLAHEDWFREATGLTEPNWSGSAGTERKFYFVRAY